MRRSRPLRTVLLSGHTIATAGWFDLLAVQLIRPQYRLTSYLIESAIIAVVTGVWLALGTAIGLIRYWWVVGKLCGTVALLTSGVLTLQGCSLPGVRPVGLAVLGLLVWLSVARPGGKTPYGQRMVRRRT
jgi:hypothetical protein